MPEVVEVKKYADFIKHHLLHKRVTQINILAGRYKTHGPFKGYKKLDSLLPLKVINVDTKGKLMWIEFEDEIFMSFTLGLSGGFLLMKAKKSTFPKIFSDEPGMVDTGEKYDIVKFQNNALSHLNIGLKIQGEIIYFYDVMSYGTASVYFSEEEFNKKLNKLGPDIMNVDTSYQTFKERIQLKKNLNKAIGNVIVNQQVISGIGNYLRSDALWLAKISPFRLVKHLKPIEIKRIYDAVRHLTWSDYDVKKGIKLGLVLKKFKIPRDYGRIFFVYQQDYDIYGNKVTKVELHEGNQKRFVHYVKALQK